MGSEDYSHNCNWQIIMEFRFRLEGLYDPFGFIFAKISFPIMRDKVTI